MEDVRRGRTGEEAGRMAEDAEGLERGWVWRVVRGGRLLTHTSDHSAN